MVDNTMNSGKKGQAWDVYIGSTHVANPEDFLKQVQSLTGKFLFELVLLVVPSDRHHFENQS